MSLNKKNSNFIIHFIGIGGIGMSGIAEIMLDQGFSIQGSDITSNDKSVIFLAVVLTNLG